MWVRALWITNALIMPANELSAQCVCTIFLVRSQSRQLTRRVQSTFPITLEFATGAAVGDRMINGWSDPNTHRPRRYAPTPSHFITTQLFTITPNLATLSSKVKAFSELRRLRWHRSFCLEFIPNTVILKFKKVQTLLASTNHKY